MAEPTQKRKINMAQRLLFIDRDSTIVREPYDEQVDSFEKLTFVDV